MTAEEKECAERALRLINAAFLYLSPKGESELFDLIYDAAYNMRMLLKGDSKPAPKKTPDERFKSS